MSWSMPSKRNQNVVNINRNIEEYDGAVAYPDDEEKYLIACLNNAIHNLMEHARRSEVDRNLYLQIAEALDDKVREKEREIKS